MNDHNPARAEVRIALIQAPDDEPLSPLIQADLLNTKRAIEAQGIEVSSFPYRVTDAVGGLGGAVGEYVIPLTAMIAPIIAGVADPWLRALSGRRVGVEFYAGGQLRKLEANTTDEVSSIMQMAARVAEPRAPWNPRLNE